jgi:hypothetical protein
MLDVVKNAPSTGIGGSRFPTLNFTCHAGTGLNRVMHAMRLVSTEKAWPDKGITNSLDTSQLAQVFVID